MHIYIHVRRIVILILVINAILFISQGGLFSKINEIEKERERHDCGRRYWNFDDNTFHVVYLIYLIFVMDK